MKDQYVMFIRQLEKVDPDSEGGDKTKKLKKRCSHNSINKEVK